MQSFDWKEFKFDRILSNNAARKICVVFGFCFKEAAIVILEKQAFTDEQLSSKKDEDNFIRNSKLEIIFKNDIYQNCFCLADVKLNKLKATVVYPATERHIHKYMEQDLFMIRETPESYEKITLPYLEKEQFSVDWVYNVLEHKTEQERIIIEDRDSLKGFMLLPDLKWDGISKETLYCTAIVMDRTIKSIRDLRESHLPLLENIREKSLQAIEEKYAIPSSQIRAYFHYQPSYYHLHVHFNYLKYDAPGIFCDKAHLIDTVIDNILLCPNYYQKATLNFVARANDKLYAAFNDS